jgi:hypothetical protein
VSGHWITPTTLSSTTLVNGHSYPVAQVKSENVSGKRVFEPGRALLLFSVRCLAGLGDRDQLAAAWWEEYLDETTGETVTLLMES